MAASITAFPRALNPNICFLFHQILIIVSPKCSAAYVVYLLYCILFDMRFHYNGTNVFYLNIIELQWLEHPQNHGNLF